MGFQFVDGGVDLVDSGFNDNDIGRIHSPIGLDIGSVSPAEIAVAIIGEITAAAQVMRELATRVHVKDTRHLVDVVGTGGDSANTFNISTASAFVAAAAGATVFRL